MKNLIGTYNENYRIEKQITLNSYTSIVWACDEDNHKFVSWYAIQEPSKKISYEFGHYSNRETKSLLDFYERVSYEIEDNITWLKDKLDYEIKNDIIR